MKNHHLQGNSGNDQGHGMKGGAHIDIGGRLNAMGDGASGVIDIGGHAGATIQMNIGAANPIGSTIA